MDFTWMNLDLSKIKKMPVLDDFRPGQSHKGDPQDAPL